MKVIGVTGSIGSGKSSVLDILRSHGIPVCSMDTITRWVTEKGTPGLALVVQKFGSTYLTSEEKLDRPALGKYVFANPDALRALETLLSPYVTTELEAWKSAQQALGKELIVIEAPLLFEKGMESQFDEIVVVTATPEVRLERIRARNNWSDEHIEQRLAQQLPQEDKVARAHHVIDNSGTKESLERQVAALISELKGGDPSTFGSSKPLPRSVSCYDKGMPCECGGYCDKVNPTEIESEKYECTPWKQQSPTLRDEYCCARAFQCRICNQRYAGGISGSLQSYTASHRYSSSTGSH